VRTRRTRRSGRGVRARLCDRPGLVALEKPHAYKTGRGDRRFPGEQRRTYSPVSLRQSRSTDRRGPLRQDVPGLFVDCAIALLALFISHADVDPRLGLGVPRAPLRRLANYYVTSTMTPTRGTMTLAGRGQWGRHAVILPVDGGIDDR